MKTTIVLFSAILFFAACTSETQKGEKAEANTSVDPDSSALAPRDNTATEVSKETKQPSASFSEIKVGMKDEKVRALLGKPTKVEVINTAVGERVEDWWYGTNQKIRTTGGQVTRIVKDVAKEQETLVKIKEAKEKGDDAEAQRLQDEIDSNN